MNEIVKVGDLSIVSFGKVHVLKGYRLYLSTPYDNADPVVSEREIPFSLIIADSVFLDWRIQDGFTVLTYLQRGRIAQIPLDHSFDEVEQLIKQYYEIQHSQ